MHKKCSYNAKFGIKIKNTNKIWIIDKKSPFNYIETAIFMLK